MSRKSNRTIRRTRIRVKQTIATLLCEEKYVGLAYEEILKLRNTIEMYIGRNPHFETSLLPVDGDDKAPEIIQRMIQASETAGAGPMSAVAGAISEYTVKAMVAAGASHVVMDNGGDIALKIDHPIVVGIFSGNSRINNMGFRLEPDMEIMGICTSSGTIGHSLSFGSADAAIVIARDVCLADAQATVLGNLIKKGEKTHIGTVLSSLMRQDITGMMVVTEDLIGVCGHIPPIVRARIHLNKISMG